MDEQRMTEIETNVQALVDQFGHLKVNLVHENGGGNEGVWVAPANAEAATKCRDDKSVGELVEVVLCNQPLGWGEFRWGQRVIAKTCGEFRPTATIDMQSGVEGEWA